MGAPAGAGTISIIIRFHHDTIAMTMPLQKMRVGDIDIEYQVSDYTDPWDDREPETILFHHGYCRNMDFWRGWVPGLARHYRVLRFNSRGCGGTTVPPAGAPYDANQLVGDALGLMDKLDIERAHWVGESSGGILGIVAALTHPERLNSLVLVNTPFKLPGAVMDTYNLGEPDHASAIEKYGVGGWCRQTLGYRLDLKKAPPAIAKKIYDATVTAMQQPSVKAVLAREGTEVSLSASPEQFNTFLKAEMQANEKIVRAANIRME